MRRLLNPTIHIASLLLIASTYVQDATAQRNTQRPMPDFSRAVAMKVYKNQDGLEVLGVVSFVETDSTEVYQANVSYVVYVPVSEIDPESKKVVTRQRPVIKTRTELRSQNKIRRHRVEVPIEDARYWTVAGEELPKEEAGKILSGTKRGFLLEQEPDDQFRGYSYSMFSVIFSEDVLLVWFDRDKAKVVAGQKKATKASKWQPSSLAPQFGAGTAQFVLQKDQQKRDQLLIALYDHRSSYMDHHFFVPLGDVTFWSTSGKPLSAEAKERLLVKPKFTPTGFVFDNPQIGLGDQFFAEMFKDDVPVIWFDKTNAIEVRSRIPQLNFRDTAIVKADSKPDGSGFLKVTVFTTKMIEKKVNVPYQETVEESYRDENGETRTRSKTVTKYRSYMESQPALSRKTIKVPVENARVWRINGDEITKDDVLEKLKNQQRCFATTSKNFSHYDDGFFTEMYRDDVYVVWYDKGQAKVVSSDE